MTSCTNNAYQLMDYLIVGMLATTFVIVVVGITLNYFNDRRRERECNERLRAAEKRVFGA